MKHRFHTSAIAHRERNDPDAARRHEWITAGLMMAFVVAVMVCAAIVGDDRQQERLAEEYAEIEQEEVRHQHQMREHKLVGPNQMKKLGDGSEDWSW